MKDQYFEHQHVVESRPPTLRAVRARHRPLEGRTEQLKIHNRTQPFQGIALGREFLQALLNIEKSSLTPHPPPPSRTRLIESRTDQNCQVFGGLQLFVDPRAKPAGGDKGSALQCKAITL